MNISLSNIAWDPVYNDTVAELMNEFGVTGVDLAPSKLWDDPLRATDADISRVRDYWNVRGITIVGAQSIHFGHPQLQLFGTPQQRAEMEEYTSRMVALCGSLGVSAIVFGSPKNRQRGAIQLEQANEIAISFFRHIGAVAVQYSTTVCIEPNAVPYGCDYINTSEEGRSLVEAIGHPGVQLHLDAGNMTMMNENIPAAIERCVPWMKHFHVSEPHLDPVGGPLSDGQHHASIATALRASAYPGWVSIEMREDSTMDASDQVRAALSFVSPIYS